MIDTLSDTVRTTVGGVTNPIAVAFNPTGTKAYVTSGPQGNAGNVVVIDTSNYSVGTRISVGTNPYSIVMSAGGTRAYVSNFHSNSVSVVDTLTEQVSATIPTGN